MLALLMKLSMLHALTNGLWLMDYAIAETYRPLVQKMLKGEKVEFAQSNLAVNFPGINAANTIVPNIWERNKFAQDLANAPKGTVPIMVIDGPIMQEDYCGSPGLKSIENWMLQADASPNIVGQVMFINSPGGSASGVKAFSNMVKDLNKPVVSYVDEIAASGGYWIASAGRKIVVSDTIANLGAIGAFSTFYDNKKRMADLGYREIQVYAHSSNKKNKIYRDLTSEDAETALAAKEEYATRFLDPLVAEFQTAVKKNRRATSSMMNEDVMAGDIFSGTEALKVGLADSIGNLNSAIQLVLDIKSKRV
jgi:ClpP class serine protease